jgi:non-ribosomal peptide synthetase component F
MRTYAGATHSFTLPAEVGGRLKRVSRREGVTVFMTLLAAFQVLLNRYTGQDDIVVGTSIANRGRVETERLLGCFFNHLALRTDLSGNPTFRELLRRVREVTLGAYAHQDIPFETLIEALQPERNSNHPPLFQVAFVFQNLPAQTLEVPGLEISAMPSPNPVSKFDLTLIVEERGELFFGVLEYNTDLFDAPTIERMSDRYQTLLGQLVENPDEEVSRAEMSAGEESRQLIYAFGDDLDGL